MIKKEPLYVLVCYVLWGVLPLFWQTLSAVSPFAVLGYRILFSLLFTFCWLLAAGRWSEAVSVLRNRREMMWLTAAGAAIAVNWGGFIYAVNNGHVLDSSLAYYMYPILSILIGTLFFREKLGPLQWVAVGLMTAGIAVTAVRYGQFPWLALMIGGSFVLYGVLKRNVTCKGEISLFVESLVTAPLALALIALCERGGTGAAGNLHGAQWLLLPAAGIVTAVPLIFFSRGIRTTPYTLSGLLMLVNPTLQFLIGIFWLGEPFTTTYAILFAFIWSGLALFLAGNLRTRHNAAHT